MTTPITVAVIGEVSLAVWGAAGCSGLQCSTETWAALPTQAALPAQAALQACAPSCSRRSSAGAGSSMPSTWAPPQPGWYSPALHAWLCIHARWLQAAWLCPVRAHGCPSRWRPSRQPGPAQGLSGGGQIATVPGAGQIATGPRRPCHACVRSSSHAWWVRGRTTFQQVACPHSRTGLHSQ